MEKVEIKQTVDYYMRDGKLVKKYLGYEERHRWVGKVREKRCSKCRKWKAESDFYKNRKVTKSTKGQQVKNQFLFCGASAYLIIPC